MVYRLKAPEHITYENAPTVDRTRDEFGYHLEGDVLTCEMLAPFPDVTSARQSVEGFLRAWEAHAAIRESDDICFVFERAEVDRGPGDVTPMAVDRARARFERALEVRNQYPEPPGEFELTPDAESVWRRYVGYLDGRERLLSTGYFCFTVLTARAGGRREAARMYAIDGNVLTKFSGLTSTRGDMQTARKAGTTGPLTNEEEVWIEATIKTFVLRLGHPDPASMQRLTMSELPPLR